MGFLSPETITALTQIGGQVGSSLLGGKIGKTSPNPLELSVLNQNMEAQKTALDAGKGLVSMGAGAVQQPMNYWASILSGDRSKATSALAPEISRIGEGYQAANQTSAALNPRGGPSAEMLSQMPYQQQRDVSSLQQTARPAAATNLAGSANNIISAGANSLYASTAAGRDILANQLAMRQLDAQRGKDIGGGLFSLFQQYGMPALAAQFPSIFGGSSGTPKYDPWGTNPQNPNNSGSNSGTGIG